MKITSDVFEAYKLLLALDAFALSRIGNGESAVQHNLWADSVEDEGKIWRDFLTILETIENPLLIHYGSYETTFIRHMHERYGEPQGNSSAAKALHSRLNLLTVIFTQFYFPAFSNGLKDVASSIGYRWAYTASSGLESIAWRGRRKRSARWWRSASR